MKSTVWIFSIEPLETRYTKQWQDHVPKLLVDKLGHNFNVVQIDGEQKNTAPTPGAFLNFSDTNYWKSSQLCKFLEHHNNGETSKNDHFIFTDAWNPTVIQLRYMSDLLGFNWVLHGLFHAGSWDSADFLGRIVGDKPWVKNAEKALFHSFDHNYFATKFHIDMFVSNLLNANYTTKVTYLNSKKIIPTGWPMEYMVDTLAPYKGLKKRNLILFPHRIAPEKQLNIFLDLKQQLPQYEFIVCQDKNLSKHEYHTLLGESKIIFSANLQETLGISSCAEGPLVESLPLVPNRLSYKEIFSNYPEFMYPSEWTTDWLSYVPHRATLANKVVNMIENYDTLVPKINHYTDNTYLEFFTADNLIANIK